MGRKRIPPPGASVRLRRFKKLPVLSTDIDPQRVSPRSHCGWKIEDHTPRRIKCPWRRSARAHMIHSPIPAPEEYVESRRINSPTHQCRGPKAQGATAGSLDIDDEATVGPPVVELVVPTEGHNVEPIPSSCCYWIRDDDPVHVANVP